MRLLSAAATASLLSLGPLVVLVSLAPSAAAAPSAGSLSVSPTAAIVGATITVTGSGLPPSTTLSLQWASLDAGWLVEGCAGCATPTPQVTGMKTSPVQTILGSAQSDSSGSLSAKMTVPADFGGSHYIQAFLPNGTALAPQAKFIVEPSFHISPTSGPAGTPIKVTATGLSYGSYSTSYHLSWDNAYTGYMTAINTHGSTNFTIYASGTPGTHFIAIYQGYPGPQYLNPQQGPPAYETQSTFPPYIPFYANFTITPETLIPQSSSGSLQASFSTHGAELGAVAAVAALAGGAFFVSRRDREERRAVSRALGTFAVVLLLVIGALALFSTTSNGSSSGSLSSSVQTNAVTTLAFTPVATVVRPQVTFPVNNATTGPRISITPDAASVGDTITVNGQGFAPDAQLPLVWTTRAGSNLHGYQQVERPLRNVTAGADGSFSFSMKVPADLGGLHFIAAGNLTRHSNGTLFLQRSATISTTQGPQGTRIQVIMQGVGWDFNTNIAAVDYDNSYIGYACGFNSGGNATVTIVASGAPGLHTIDVYPSVWWGPSTYLAQQIVEYRYPILTPQDHPELMPSFHFTFLMTSNGSSTQAAGFGPGSSFGVLGGAALVAASSAAVVVCTYSRLSLPFRAAGKGLLRRY